MGDCCEGRGGNERSIPLPQNKAPNSPPPSHLGTRVLSILPAGSMSLLPDRSLHFGLLLPQRGLLRTFV